MTGPVDLDAIARWFDDLERMGLPAKSVRALVAEVEALRQENARLVETLASACGDIVELQKEVGILAKAYENARSWIDIEYPEDTALYKPADAILAKRGGDT